MVRYCDFSQNYSLEFFFFNMCSRCWKVNRIMRAEVIQSTQKTTLSLLGEIMANSLIMLKTLQSQSYENALLVSVSCLQHYEFIHQHKIPIQPRNPKLKTEHRVNSMMFQTIYSPRYSSIFSGTMNLLYKAQNQKEIK